MAVSFYGWFSTVRPTLQHLVASVADHLFFVSERSFFIRRSYPTYFADKLLFPLHGSLIAGVVCISVWFGGLC